MPCLSQYDHMKSDHFQNNLFLKKSVLPHSHPYLNIFSLILSNKVKIYFCCFLGVEWIHFKNYLVTFCNALIHYWNKKFIYFNPWIYLRVRVALEVVWYFTPEVSNAGLYIIELIFSLCTLINRQCWKTLHKKGAIAKTYMQ